MAVRKSLVRKFRVNDPLKHEIKSRGEGGTESSLGGNLSSHMRWCQSGGQQDYEETAFQSGFRSVSIVFLPQLCLSDSERVGLDVASSPHFISKSKCLQLCDALNKCSQEPLCERSGPSEVLLGNRIPRGRALADWTCIPEDVGGALATLLLCLTSSPRMSSLSVTHSLPLLSGILTRDLLTIDFQNCELKTIFLFIVDCCRHLLQSWKSPKQFFLSPY